MPPEPRRPVLDVPPAVHGALDFGELQRLGLHPDDVLDFSANTNPYGASPAVRAALANTPLDRYPDREALALRAALADSLSAPIGRIVAGNGASELILLAALAFVRPGDPVLVIGPTYGEYARAAALMGGRVTTWQARAEDDFAPDVAAIADPLRRISPRLVFVCNPNNPTGAALAPEVLAALARRRPATLFVVDEAYQSLAADRGSALEIVAENVLVLRSMTKDCGLAGLRLGYAIGPERLVEALRRAQPPWSVNALAQAAGIAALGDPAHRARSLELIGAAKAGLIAELTRFGLPPVPSVVPFFLVRVGDGAAFRRTLLARGVLVRDCASFGLPEHARISTRRPEENERLLAAIREVL
jgi:histidinol-phosphate aminotransferase